MEARLRLEGIGWTMLTLLLCACTVGLVAPQPTHVSPAFGWNGEDTPVTISGDRFYPRIEVDASGTGGRAQVNRGFEAVLEGEGMVHVDLTGVSLEDYQHLQAVVPQGLATGTYDLAVVGPTGETGRLASAFTVSDTRADRIAVDSDSVVYEVHQTAWVDISLLDPQGNPVLSDLTVAVVVTDDNGAVPATFEDGGLDDQQPFGAGFGIIGHLGADGVARVGLTVDTPNTVNVTVSPGANDSQQVAEGSLKLRFTAGSQLALDIGLPDEPFETTAGTSFPIELTLVDQYGNPVPDASELVILKDACDSWVDALQVTGNATDDVVLHKATGTATCLSEQILSVSGPSGPSGVSSDVVVNPGPVDHLDVVTSPPSVVAGQPDLDAVITPLDAWDNRADWSYTTLSLTDSVGGVATADCGRNIPVFCTVASTVAASDITLHAQDDAGTAGTSGPYTVLPAAPQTVDVALASSPVTAGTPVLVKVRLRDAYGNAVSDAASAADVTLTSAGDTPTCTPMPGSGDGLTFSCALYAARSDAVLAASVAGLDLQGSSAPFAVQNGPLSEVQVTPAVTATTAGQPVDLDFAGFDAWGNPYVVQSDPTVQVADTGGTLSLGEITLDAAGRATGQGTFTLAGTTRVLALQGGAELGRSAAILVDPGPADSLVVGVSQPWVWVGTDVPVDVGVVDAWDNRADWSGTVEVTSESGDVGPVAVGVSGGAGAGSLRWSTPDLAEKLHATSTADSLSGSSLGFAVVQACASGGPAADVTFDGFSQAVLCLDAQGEAQLSASLAGSTPGPGAVPLALYGMRVGSASVTGTGPSLSLNLGGAGRFDVHALATRADGCADEIAAQAWVGPDDGRPTGPLAVHLATSSLAVGSDSTVVSVVGATDCARSPAAGGMVLLRTDRGALADATATGGGLAVTLDSNGDGQATLDATAPSTGGAATVVGWGLGGTALGTTTATFTGDLRLPQVWSQTPSGATTGTVDTVALQFSEAMDPATVVPSSFSVTGPSAVTVSDVGLDPSGRTATLTLSPAVDAGAGGWVVTVTDSLLDLAGNALDGADAGVAGSWVGSFGDLPPQVDPVSACTPDVTLFRPDGDDGAGTEADEVVYSIASNSEPIWWSIAVLDSGGDVLRHARVAPRGASDTWTWGGRDATRQVVPSGAYLVVVDAEDASGNSGGACTAAVTVAQHAEVLP